MRPPGLSCTCVVVLFLVTTTMTQLDQQKSPEQNTRYRLEAAGCKPPSRTGRPQPRFDFQDRRGSSSIMGRLMGSDTLSPSPAAELFNSTVFSQCGNAGCTHRGWSSGQNGATGRQYRGGFVTPHHVYPSMYLPDLLYPDMVVPDLTTIGCFDQARSYPRSWGR